MEFHEAAAIFPLMVDDDLEQLAESIKANGLHESIKLLDGKIVDGRNRFTACTLAGVEPRFEQAKFKGLAADYVFAVNDKRRHMTIEQRGLAAAKYKKQVAIEAKDRQRVAGKVNGRGQKVQPKRPEPIKQPQSRDIAGKKFDISGKRVDASEKILKRGAPEVVAAVERGELKTSTAAKLVEAPKRAQKAAVEGGPREVKRTIKTVERARAAKPVVEAAERTDQDQRKAIQADARRYWLREVVDFIGWTERHIAGYTDDYLVWYGEPDSPGCFDHGITAERISAAIHQLERIREHSFGGTNGKPKK